MNKSDYNKKYLAEHREQINARRRERYWSGDGTRERQTANTREWRKKNPEKSRETVRKWKYLNKYGITIEDYEDLYVKQGGVCAICGAPPAGPGTNHGHRLKVDHDHATGEVRGLLCNTCNLLLGRYERYRKEVTSYLDQNRISSKE